LDNKARFVQEVCRGDLVVTNRKKHELLGDLIERGYVNSTDDADDGVGEENDILNDETPNIELAKGFEYLLGMKIWSLTSERVQEICRQMVEKAEEVKLLEATSPEKIWLDDLDAIEKLLDDRDKTIGVEDETHKCNKLKVYQSSAKKRTKSNQHEDEVSDVILSTQHTHMMLS
jgi:DNA topoisomerase-2